MSGAEDWLVPDFQACVNGNVNQVSDQYLSVWDGVTLPGFTKDGRSGASVNHMTLAGGIASYKQHPDAEGWWQRVAEHWVANGFGHIENQTSNVYHEWILFPVLAGFWISGVLSCGSLARAHFNMMALGGHPTKSKYGPLNNEPVQTWKGYATTMRGARSWRYRDGRWIHLDQNNMDRIFHWAVTSSLAELPGPGSFIGDCARALNHTLSSAEQGDMNSVINGVLGEALDRVLDRANYATVHNPTTIIRTHNQVATLLEKSFNGNTQCCMGSTYDRISRFHEFLGFGDGSRNNDQGTAWNAGVTFEARSNDGLGSGTIFAPSGEKLYEIRVPARGAKWGVTYRADDTGTQPPVEPPEPPTKPEPPDPPTQPPTEPEDGLTPSERDHYASEIEQMANRQQQLADRLANSTSAEDDLYVAQQLTHQGNKAHRLSREMADLLGTPTHTVNNRTSTT